MTRHGSIWTPGGYQAPSTNAAALERGQPLRQLRWLRNGDTLEIHLKLVPLLHGRPELFEIEYRWNDTQAKHSYYIACVVRGERWARGAFEATAAELDAGGLPDAVIVLAGTPLGP